MERERERVGDGPTAGDGDGDGGREGGREGSVRVRERETEWVGERERERGPETCRTASADGPRIATRRFPASAESPAGRASTKTCAPCRRPAGRLPVDTRPESSRPAGFRRREWVVRRSAAGRPAIRGRVRRPAGRPRRNPPSRGRRRFWCGRHFFAVIRRPDIRRPGIRRLLIRRPRLIPQPGPGPDRPETAYGHRPPAGGGATAGGGVAGFFSRRRGGGSPFFRGGGGGIAVVFSPPFSWRSRGRPPSSPSRFFNSLFFNFITPSPPLPPNCGRKQHAPSPP